MCDRGNSEPGTPSRPLLLQDVSHVDDQVVQQGKTHIEA